MSPTYDTKHSDSQAEGREFEPRVPLREKVSVSESLPETLRGVGAPETAKRGLQNTPESLERVLNRPQIVHGYGVRRRTIESELIGSTWGVEQAVSAALGGGR